MNWEVELHSAFESELDALPRQVRTTILAKAHLLREFGPDLGRPYVDTLEGSRFPNMKELRCGADDGVWRIAFAFDPDRRAVLLVAGDKAGEKERRFYKRLIATADERFAVHLQNRKGGS